MFLPAEKSSITECHEEESNNQMLSDYLSCHSDLTDGGDNELCLKTGENFSNFRIKPVNVSLSPPTLQPSLCLGLS